jgi:ribosomal protein L19E
MKKIIIVLFGIFLINTAFSQEKPKLDTIYLLGQRKMVVDIKGVRYASVVYSDSGSSEIKSIETKQIQRIIFDSGRKEIFNDKLVMNVEKTDWRNVITTENEDEVNGLYELGKVKGKSAAGNRTPKSAERTATIRMKKEAAGLGAEMILITKKEARGGFGEVPTFYIEGVAYSFTKPQKE